MSTMHEDDAFEDRDVESRDFERLLGEVRQMDDAALDALVARTAASYNAPPARPPVDAMWAHIAKARKPAVRGGIHVQRWQLLAASVAFLAFGITIGRQWTDVAAHAGASAPRAATASTRSGSTPSAVATTVSTAAPSAESTQVAAAEPADASTVDASTIDASHEVASTTRSRTHAAPRVNASTPSVASSTSSSTTSSTTRGASSDAAYRMATMRHFVQAEALLASYDGSAHDAKTDAQLASWASDLLSQTRLLLDSPAGRDPVRRRLLQDLELVLVQMAQLDPNAPQLEHDLIDGSVRHNDIITRLRNAVPAGATTAL